MSAFDGADLFAGVGGWEVHDPGRVLGIEKNGAAVDTRRVAGFDTLHGDVRKFDRATIPLTRRLIASPPCQSFSRAGKGDGRSELDEILAAVKVMGRYGSGEHFTFGNENTDLVLEPLRWALMAHENGHPYESITLEQVPAVLPVWEGIAAVLKGMGYSVATGNLRAEQYGVPQTRERAILAASRVKTVALPKPTHSKFHSRTPGKIDAGVERWVSMAEALGWGMTERPYFTVAAGTKSGGADPAMIGGSGARKALHKERDEGRWLVGFGRKYDGGSGGPVEINGQTLRRRDFRSADQPSFVVTEKARSWMRHFLAGDVMPDGRPRVNNQSGTDFDLSWPLDRPSPVIAGRDIATMPGANANRFNGSTKSRNDGIRVTVAEAAVLQSFPVGYPWQGTRTEQFQQIGNAIPPRLAEHVRRAVA